MATATKTRTIGGLRWWELFEANSSVWLAKTCTELMEIAARRIQG